MLGIPRFEADAEVIRDAAARQMAHVRTYHLGQHAELSQKILNELGVAKACLLSAAKKAAYDARLRQEMAAHAVPIAAPPVPPAPVLPPAAPSPATTDVPQNSAVPEEPDVFTRMLAGIAAPPALQRQPKRRVLFSLRSLRHVPRYVWIATAAAAATLFVLAVILSIRTEYGTVEIELPDLKGNKVEVKIDGNTIDINGPNKPLRLKVGEHGLEVTCSAFETFTQSFSIRARRTRDCQGDPRTETQTRPAWQSRFSFKRRSG